MGELANITYPLAIIVAVAFGIAACVYQYLRERKQGKPDSADFFLTARRSVKAFTIGWSFYAAAMGSWALFGPPSYVLFAGMLGMISYAVSAGIPILVIALFGSVIHRLVPNVISFADFVERRFGLLVSMYVSGLLLFNMGVALTAEYTAVGDLFEFVIISKRVPIVVVIGGVAMLYTAWGGLYVSIITDQWQAITSVVLIFVLFIYVWVTYDAPLGPLPDNLRADNYYGLASIGVLPISLISSTLFSEAMWQRCWASEDSGALIWGAVGGSIAVIFAVFLFGLGGFLAAWGNVWVPSGPDDSGNTIIFSLLNNKTWIITLVAILAVTMSESAIDSLQNAIVDTISSSLISIFPYLKTLDLLWIRILVVVLNIPPIVVSLQKYNILQLFLLANLITTTSFIPIMLGVVQGTWSRMIVTPFSVMFGCVTGFSSLLWWTLIKQKDGQSYKDALHATFLEAYDYPPFFIAMGMSIFGLFVGALLELLFRTAFPFVGKYPAYNLGRSSDEPQNEAAPAKYVDEVDSTEKSQFTSAKAEAV